MSISTGVLGGGGGGGAFLPLTGGTITGNGAASTPPLSLSGTWFTGGTATTTKPQFLIEPAGTLSTGWNTSGTGLGVNAPSGFAGSLADFQVAGLTQASIGATGNLLIGLQNQFGEAKIQDAKGDYLSLFFGTFNFYDGADGAYLASIKNGGLNFWFNSAQLMWSSTYSGSPDTGIARNGAGIVEINNGTAGTFADLKLRNLAASGTTLGLYGATPVVQPATIGTATGFTQSTGTIVMDASTFTGGTGTKAYRVSDIVLALKQIGILAAS